MCDKQMCCMIGFLTKNFSHDREWLMKFVEIKNMSSPHRLHTQKHEFLLLDPLRSAWSCNSQEESRSPQTAMEVQLQLEPHTWI